MAIEEIKKRFVNEIKLRAYDDKYIDKNEEREILQIAIQLGVSIDSARGALVSVCDEHNYVVESVVLKQVKDQVETAFSNDGKIDQKEFGDALSLLKTRTQGKKNEIQCKRMIIEIIEENNYKVKTGLFSNWFTRTKREVGMA